MQFYNINTWPYIAVLDPRTGKFHYIFIFQHTDFAYFTLLVPEACICSLCAYLVVDLSNTVTYCIRRA